MTRSNWGIAAGVAALLGIASLAPATAMESHEGGTLSPTKQNLTWSGASSGISTRGLCDNVGGQSCFEYDLEVAEGLETKQIHLNVFATLEGLGVSREVVAQSPAADFDIWLFKNGVRELARAHDPDNGHVGSFSAETGSIDEIVLLPGELAAGHYDVLVVTKAAAPGTVFQSEIWTTDVAEEEEGGGGEDEGA